MPAAMLCGPTVVMQIGCFRPSSASTTARASPYPWAAACPSPQIEERIAKTLEMVCGYARLPSFQGVFRRSLNAIDRFLEEEEGEGEGEVVLSSRV